jgi:hypothetical protein
MHCVLLSKRRTNITMRTSEPPSHAQSTPKIVGFICQTHDSGVRRYVIVYSAQCRMHTFPWTELTDTYTNTGRPGTERGSFHAGFVVLMAELWQVLSSILVSPACSHFTTRWISLICHARVLHWAIYDPNVNGPNIRYTKNKEKEFQLQ